MKTYQVIASRDGKFWLVYVPEINQYTQARNIAEIEEMARDLIACWLEIDEDSFAVQVKIELPPGVQAHLARAVELRNQAAQAQSDAAREYRAAAHELKAQGLTVRDIGDALDVSHQRAHQLVSASSD